MKALYIVDWQLRYEVNDRNRAWQVGEKLRAGALPFYRSKVCGRSWGAGYRLFLKIARGSAASAFGIFHKLIELAADGPPERRGFVLDRHGRPMESADIACATGFAKHRIERALEILMDTELRWIEQAEYTPSPGNARNHPGFPGNSPSYTDTETDTESDTDTHTGGEIPQRAKYTIPDAQLVISRYNEVCAPAGLPRAIDSNGKRKKIRTRLKEPVFRKRFPEVFKLAAESLFMRGHGPRGWVADLTWLVANDENYVKVLEGRYANREGQDGRGTAKDRKAVPRPSDLSKDPGHNFNL